MRNYLAFTRKEVTEHVHTYKLLIILLVFLLFGIMNPFTAKFTPELLASFMPEGMALTLPTPSALDSWAQFFKNATQMGLIVMVLVLSGTLSTELSRGTLINMLTKGLSRNTVILSKYSAMILLWTAALLVSLVTTWGYTVYLFPGEEVSSLIFSVFCLWVFGALLLALLLFGSALTKSNYGGLLLTGGFVALLFLINIFPAVQDYSPLMLASNNMNLLNGTNNPDDFLRSLAVTGAGIVGIMGATLILFRKRSL